MEEKEIKGKKVNRKKKKKNKRGKRERVLRTFHPFIHKLFCQTFF
jgi:hypothetical protein